MRIVIGTNVIPATKRIFGIFYFSYQIYFIAILGKL